VRREIPPRSVGADDVRAGRVAPHYRPTLTRLLAAHALAEKLTALGYERALRLVDEPELRPTLEKNLVEERKHARLVYRALADLEVSEQAADHSMVAAYRGPSFEAPRRFAEHTQGELDLLMASVAVDMTGLIMIGMNYRDSSYAPHAQASELILEEEADHDVFASELLGQAVERFGARRVNLALREWIPRAVNFFGPPRSPFTYDCIRFGLKANDNGELAELYLTMLERRTSQLGLRLPRLTPLYPHAAA
jgi:1,2-phenylacetyl-CoA epoxidase catalytic subunit